VAAAEAGIVVEGVTKRFAGRVALDAVAFAARPGEVLGLLGPNGAGKTTTMRIALGYVTPDAGRVTLAGIDVADEPRRARAACGYLPESCPLPGELRVSEYLAHRAALKDVPRRERRARVDEVVAQVGLGEARERVIGQLSKGYRQRVGLADALLARPPVLILDEPTDGLDPNQRREVLDLVRVLGRERAVVLSTHVLPEVQAVASRVVILDRGRVVAEGPLDALDNNGGGALVVVARGDEAALRAAIAAVPGVLGVEGALSDGGAGELRFTVRAERDVREELARAVVEAGALRALHPASRGLEELFARLTSEARA
jgi:ABC-2 type transport system ATP-binding protein